MRLISKAPANSMLLGEHSVVYGYPALACALDQWIEIDWQVRNDRQIHIESALGNIQTDWNTIELYPKLLFVMHALKAFQAHRLPGLNIRISSEFSSTIGLGSSAAVLAATLVGLNHLSQGNLSSKELWQIGKQVILDIQGRGSATDLAASLFGGVVYFQPPSKSSDSQIASLNVSMPLLLVYSGYKTPTSDVLAKVAEEWLDQPEQLQTLYRQMGLTTLQAYQALQQQDYDAFYRGFGSYQMLMAQLGVSDENMDYLIEQLVHCPQVCACKISGSGLGDCVVAIGAINRTDASSNANLLVNCPAETNLADYLQLQLPITPQGAHIVSAYE
ncbi:GHMP kinase [Thiomicrorhabdus sp.]|uniref:mevalonate kinase family protein n=1 Tax=Thiomicrorhabdus sp. TaxID=2039724 RepID=UPI0029C78B2D|nr:GHMP kinase [Thiomicrorhabdus sp.]